MMGGRQEALLVMAAACYGAALLGYLGAAASARAWPARAATALAVVGLLAHLSTLISRGLAAGHLPLVNMYGYVLAFAWAVMAAYLAFEWRYRQGAAAFRVAGALAALLALGLLIYALRLSPEAKQDRALMPVLRSNWLVVHISVAVIGYGAAGLASALAALYFLSSFATRNARWLAARLPSPAAADQAVHRTVLFAFPFLSLVNITGAMWAYNAWGRYWGWDPKETWALITWMVYTFYLHARLRAGWRAPAVNAVAVTGFAAVLFTMLAVSQLAAFSSSMHSYAAR